MQIGIWNIKKWHREWLTNLEQEINRYLGAHHFDIHLNEMAKGKTLSLTFSLTHDIGKWVFSRAKKVPARSCSMGHLDAEKCWAIVLLAGYLSLWHSQFVKFNAIFTAMNMKQGKNNDIVILVLVQVWGSNFSLPNLKFICNAASEITFQSQRSPPGKFTTPSKQIHKAHGNATIHIQNQRSLADFNQKLAHSPITS